MKLDIEPIIFTCRLYPNEYIPYTDRYIAVCTIQRINKDTAYISGYHGEYNKEVRKLLANKLKEYNFTKAIFVTATGREYEIEFK